MRHPLRHPFALLTSRLSAAGFAAAALCASAPLSAFAQSDTPLAPLERTFLIENAQGSIYDYTTAEAAANHANSNDVRDYAVKLLDDHTRLNKDILTLARAKNLSLPLTLQKSDEKKLKSLTKKQGDAFDRAYLEEAIKINADDVSKAKKELATTTNSDVKDFVTNFMQTEEKHLQDARDLLAKMK